MPIDLMSPVQALESATVKLTAMKEAKEYKKIQTERQAKADTRAEAKEARDVEKHEATLNKINAQIEAIKNKNAREDEKTKIAQQRADAETSKAESYAKISNSQLTPEQKLEMAKIDLRKTNSITRRERYKMNSAEMVRRSQEALNEEQETIRNNQVNLGGE